MPHSEKYKIILHKLGYYSYQEGLIYRHLRQKGGWDAHLGNCRRFILKSADLIKPRKITVLGSGWLLDFPIAEILEKGLDITLIDIVHPPEVKRQLAGNKQIKLIEDDLTGGLIEEVWEKAGRLPFFKKLGSPDDIKIPEYRTEENPGMVVSLNLLSQLDVLPLRLLERKIKVTANGLLRLRSEIQQKHLDFLKQHKSVLISDIREVFTDRLGNETVEDTVVIPLPETETREEWTWDFDLTHTDSFNKNSVLKVVAMVL